MPEDPNPFGDDLFGHTHVGAYRETGAGLPLARHDDPPPDDDWAKVRRAAHNAADLPRTRRRWIVVSSNGGAPDHQDWFKNLSRNPEASIQVKAEQFAVRAHGAQGEERTRPWGLMSEVWPAYDEYRRRTTARSPWSCSSAPDGADQLAVTATTGIGRNVLRW